MEKRLQSVQEHFNIHNEYKLKNATYSILAKNIHETSRRLKESKLEDVKCRKVNRLLILQGGGALGAYEVGVLKFLSEALQKEDNESGNPSRPLFDIVAGSSMGAVNAAILIHNVVFPEHKTLNPYKKWEQSIKRLHDFYMEISDPNLYHPLWWMNKFCLEERWFEQFWSLSSLVKKLFLTINATYRESFLNNQMVANLVKNIRKDDEESSFLFPGLQYTNFLKQDNHDSLPTAENARRYYYYLNSILYGIPKVLSPAIIQPDLLYFDPLWSTHVYTRFSNEPLVKTMKKFWNYDKFPIKTNETQPRLMLVMVDIEDSTVPVIIDSYAKGKEKNSSYSEYGNSTQYRLEYENGITADHVRASMSTPLRYEYPSFKVYNKETKQNEIRHFWDGALIANSPVREVIKAHTDYWRQQDVIEQPDLEIYMVNLYPTVKKGIPDEPYSIQDRETDMRFQSRITLDEIMDDVNWTSIENTSKNIVGSANQKNNKKSRKPKILKFIKIERHEEVENSVFGKAFDFSRKTIIKLIDDGYQDAKRIME